MEVLLRKKSTICALVIPGVLILAAGILFPIIMSVYLSFTDSSMGSNAAFVGIKNYVELLGDENFKVAVLHAVILCVAYLVILNPVALAFAFLLDKIGGRTEKVLRILFFIPCVISLMVTSKMWLNVLNPTFGMLNKLLTALGLGQLKQNWLMDPDLALFSVMFIAMWQLFGWVMIVYYAGVKGIPEELYEAASIDGCSGWQRIRYIGIPHLRPVLRVNMMLSLINALKEMEIIFLTTNGGPGNRTEFIATYLYKTAFKSFRYGYANAISGVFIILCLVASVFYQKMTASNEDVS